MLLIALFPREWGKVKFTGVTKPSLIVAGHMVIVSPWDRHLYGKELHGINHVKWQSRKSPGRFLISLVCVMADPVLLRFQACLEVDSCSLLLKRCFTLGRDLCKTEGILMDWLTDLVPIAAQPEGGRDLEHQQPAWARCSQQTNGHWPGHIGNGKNSFVWICKISDFSREQSFGESVPGEGQAAALCLVTHNRSEM